MRHALILVNDGNLQHFNFWRMGGRVAVFVIIIYFLMYADVTHFKAIYRDSTLLTSSGGHLAPTKEV